MGIAHPSSRRRSPASSACSRRSVWRRRAADAVGPRARRACGRSWRYVRGSWPSGRVRVGEPRHLRRPGTGSLLPLASVTGVWGISFVVHRPCPACPAARARARQDAGRPRRSVIVALGSRADPRARAHPHPGAERPDASTWRRCRSMCATCARPRRRSPRIVAVAAMNIQLHERLATDPPDLAVWGEVRSTPARASPRSARWWSLGHREGRACRPSPARSSRRSGRPNLHTRVLSLQRQRERSWTGTGKVQLGALRRVRPVPR